MLYTVCVSFFGTVKWVSNLYTHNPFLLKHPAHLPPSHPSRSLQSTRLGFLCYTATSHQWSILHRIVHICWMLLFPVIPHSPSPTVPINPFYLHLHSFLANRFINTIFLDLTYIYSNIWFFFSFLSTSFYITILGSSTSLKLTEIHSFLWLSSISLYICNTSSLSIHLSTDI